jgi:hypothetical protein
MDPTFDPGTLGPVQALGIRTDGGALLGGQLINVGGQARSLIAALLPTDPATQSLNFDGSTVRWLRGGTCPEVWRTAFEVSTNATNWTLLGAGTRMAGGWQLAGLSLASNAMIRACGFAAGGYRNASSWFEETTLSLSPPSPPSHPHSRQPVWHGLESIRFQRQRVRRSFCGGRSFVQSRALAAARDQHHLERPVVFHRSRPHESAAAILPYPPWTVTGAELG